MRRKTGDDRAAPDGLADLAEPRSGPREGPSQLAEDVTCALIRLKLRHPTWGPEKICEFYEKEHRRAPEVSSCDRILRLAGLVESPRPQSPPETGRITVGVAAKAPNEVWTVDFSGYWRFGNGGRREPLVVGDAFSRFILTAKALPDSKTPGMRAEFVRLFEEYGLPNGIKSESDRPFVSSLAPLGLSSLSAWWVSLGIKWDWSPASDPSVRGGTIPLHHDLHVEIAKHVQPNLAGQQAALDLWREEFNWKRPHKALGGQRPGEVYSKSARSFRSCAGALEYGPGYFSRKISPAGMLRWRSSMIFISRAVAGHCVGLKPQSADFLEVWFNYLHLGDIELQTKRFLGARSCSGEPASSSAWDHPR